MPEPISKAKEEEMSSALIAQLLAEDAISQGNVDYYAEYSNGNHYENIDDSYEDNSEDDFDPKKKGRTNNNKKEPSQSRRGRKRKALVTEEVKEESSNDTDEKVAKGQQQQQEEEKEKQSVSKKPRKPVPEGYNTGVYTELEEKSFLEGLELFGRDWTKLQAHVATRDSNSIRSHAQKHFIKMFRDSIPLPDKVRETGDGYTLSGKPLDPNSAAAKPYLKSMVKLDQEKKPEEDGVVGVEKQTKELTINEKKQKKIEKKVKSNTPSPSNSLTKGTSEPAPYDSTGRTSYSSSRLRKQRESINYGQITKDDDPLTMIKCEPFIGKPGSNTAGSQPFQMIIQSNVLLSMDFHAHLMTTEIIGFLAGDWDKETMRIVVREAYPCRSIETGRNDVNVEMDPTSAIETRQMIEERNLKVVGWYHSHPTFIPDPSLVDIENQRNYQILCRDEENSTEPFVGAIVGPYDPNLPGSASVINWFHVDSSNSERPIPKRLIYDLQEDEHISNEESDRLFKLLEMYKDSPEKSMLNEQWRQDISESKLEKMIKSLGSRMPWVQKKLKESSDFTDSFLEKVQQNLKSW
ncbi:hypothetical protein G6F55_009471 [Rhizopus delemar]|uniref:MPN domain-containing protein n=1 Tax=Rhizopus delemar TaxID=936053 RepID=A0A9P7CKV9_9FUNG|nr:hypothetical protein G6F55_009471 [Rhizopus delemar]KAG1491587.1 hypothetical protein G6F54_009912 [Rhizopus delemar]KAG1520842.1 hypothetical protein G6F52_007288 [Rhizopus delemar]KAG1565291.1 hypothetical protein G6F50_010207 [Rhizopus delemar]KAG1624345.1 hypothetical protein G6F45_010119 [Rhizopus arrhizus]